MNPHLAASRLNAKKTSLAQRVLASFNRTLRLVFISGPHVLLTSRISGRCALVMMVMCSPSLVFCGLLTIPGLIFQSPQQQAYFHFSRALNEDPTRWIVLVVAGLCTLLSLAMPAMMRHRSTTIRY